MRLENMRGGISEGGGFAGFSSGDGLIDFVTLGFWLCSTWFID
jgi:hypothetical protein